MLNRSMLFALGYILLHKVLVFIAAQAKQKAKAQFNRNKRPIREKPKLSLQQKLRRSKKYALKEKTETRIILIPAYLVGLIATVIFGTFEFYTIAILLLFYPFILYIVLFKMTKKDLQARDLLFERMLTLKQSKMGYATPKDKEVKFDTEFQILEWDNTKIFPKKIRIFIPVTFDSINVDSFMTQFNLAFGDDQAWTPDVEDKEYPGWQFKQGIATIKADDPLPTKASWSKDWLNSEFCAWSYFPLAIGTQGGTMMPDPATGKEVHILGTDFAGEQQKLAKKTGIWCSQEIQASPQVLIAGATGGGKALGVNTKIYEDSLKVN